MLSTGDGNDWKWGFEHRNMDRHILRTELFYEILYGFSMNWDRNGDRNGIPRENMMGRGYL
jgi:hypothetical protein